MHLVGEFREISKHSLKLKFCPLNENCLYSFSITRDKSYKCGCFRFVFGVVSLGIRVQPHGFLARCLTDPSQVWERLSHLKVGLSWFPQEGSCRKGSLLTIRPWVRLNPRTVLRCLLHPVPPAAELCAIVGRQENLPVWSKTIPPRTRPDKGVVTVVFSWRRELFRHALYTALGGGQRRVCCHVILWLMFIRTSVWPDPSPLPVLGHKHHVWIPCWLLWLYALVYKTNPNICLLKTFSGFRKSFSSCDSHQRKHGPALCTGPVNAEQQASSVAGCWGL